MENNFIWLVIEYLFSLFEIILFFNFLSHTLKKKFNQHIYILSIGLYFIVTTYITNILPFSNNTIIIIVLISLIFALCIYNGETKSKVVFTLIFFMLLVMCDVFTANMLGIIMRINIQEAIFKEKWFRGFLFCISKLILILILRRISYFVGKDKINIPSRYWYIIISTSTISLIILIVIGEIGIIKPNYYNKSVYFIIVSVGILMINIFAQYIFIQLGKYYEKEQLYNIINIRNKIIEEYYIEMDQVYKETRKLGHDFKNHIYCILTLIDSNKIYEAKNYIRSIGEDIKTHTTLIKSGNDIVDIILNQKLVEAQKLDVNMDILAIVPNVLEIKSMDLCAILANVIDNAIEASVKISDANKRKVKVKINPYKDYLLIAVSNTCLLNPLTNIKTFKSTKVDNKNHGLGIKIVHNTIEKYNGSIEYNYEDITFTLKILI